MIRPTEVRRYAAEQHIDISVAVQEVVLTILLRRIALSDVGDLLAFKGGTALRKIVFGAAGRFSEDLDFACLADDSELVQLQLLEEMQPAEPADEIAITIMRNELSGPGTLQATFTFDCPIGQGRFELDVTSSEKPVLLGAMHQALVPQRYFSQLGFDIPEIMSVRTIEMATEKLAAIHRRYENGNPKDVWDLWKWISATPPDQLQLVTELWPARLWLDGLAGDVEWRGPGWAEQLNAGKFNWDRLTALLPRTQPLKPEEVIAGLKDRLRPWIDNDDDGVLSDVGDGRQRRRESVEARIQAVRDALHLDA
jgi:predicted nucleotidyltransferase component of viral defense system